MMEGTQEWLWNIAVKKVVIGIVGYLASAAVAPKLGAALTFLAHYGVSVTIDPTVLQVSLTALLIGSFHGVHDWLKLKAGWAWL